MEDDLELTDEEPKVLRSEKGEKSKKPEKEKRKPVLAKKESAKEDLREVTKSNFNLLRRKLSGNIARKI